MANANGQQPFKQHQRMATISQLWQNGVHDKDELKNLTKYSERQVKRHIDTLEESGSVERKKCHRESPVLTFVKKTASVVIVVCPVSMSLTRLLRSDSLLPVSHRVSPLYLFRLALRSSSHLPTHSIDIHRFSCICQIRQQFRQVSS